MSIDRQNEQAAARLTPEQRVAGLVYMLVRDHLTAGELEQMIKTLTGKYDGLFVEHAINNTLLGKYATGMAEMLMRGRGARNESS